MRGVLLDCDYIIATFVQNESTHSVAQVLNRAAHHVPQFILRSTLYELATVLSRKFGQEAAIAIVQEIMGLSVQVIEPEIVEPAAWQIFKAQKKKSTSFFDCLVMAAAQHYGLHILSFDSFYPKELLFAP